MRYILLLSFIISLLSCKQDVRSTDTTLAQIEGTAAKEVRKETLRAWKAYVKYAWGHDNLKPLSRSYEDWYEGSLNISTIDAYSTLHLMGLSEETKRIERYVIDSLTFELDLDVKVFEVNIRILGGLLSIYEFTGNKKAKQDWN